MSHMHTAKTINISSLFFIPNTNAALSPHYSSPPTQHQLHQFLSLLSSPLNSRRLVSLSLSLCALYCHESSMRIPCFLELVSLDTRTIFIRYHSRTTFCLKVIITMWQGTLLFFEDGEPYPSIYLTSFFFLYFLIKKISNITNRLPLLFIHLHRLHNLIILFFGQIGYSLYIYLPRG